MLPQFGWRGAFVVGAFPALYVAYLRRALPESPRFLAEHGRAAEADAVVRRVEREGGGALITITKPVAPERTVGGTASIGALFAPRYARRTAMLWILWFGITLTYYGIFTFIPSLLAGRGLTVVRSNEYFFISSLAQVPGYFSAAWLVERIGRRPTLVAYLVGSAIAAYLFGNSGPGNDAIVFAALLSFFNLGAWGVVYTISPELYPTALPFLTPTLTATSLGQSGVFALFMGLLLITAGAVALLGEETRGKSLEEIAPAA